MELTNESRPTREVLSHVANEDFSVKLIADASGRLYGITYTVEVTRLATGQLISITGSYNRCLRHMYELTKGMVSIY